MIDQLIIGEKASFDDFGASVASRVIKQPKKKTIKETVPFSNVTYDFSAINGEVYWEEREIDYEFEITASSPEKLEQAKIAFANWIMNVIDEEIFDPFIPDYHFKGTFADMDFADEDNVEKTTATVKFAVYPYKISNYPSIYEIELLTGEKKPLVVTNDSSHRITPTIITNGAIAMEIGLTTYTISAGTYEDSAIKLPVGTTSLMIENKSGKNCAVQVKFIEEVF